MITGARIGLIALVGMIAGLALVVGTGRDPEPTAAKFDGDLRAGGRIEELRLPRLQGDGVVEYATYADRPLVINFFASWCPSCIAEMPEFERVHRLLGGEVAFLGISQSDAREASIELAHEAGITYDTAIDERGEFFRAVGGVGMPTTVFVRPGGRIAEVWIGALDAEALQNLMVDHFGISA
jgi:thiol-disulfide isomerase/thioredoxin